jgi:hypothetical protein
MLSISAPPFLIDIQNLFIYSYDHCKNQIQKPENLEIAPHSSLVNAYRPVLSFKAMSPVLAPPRTPVFRLVFKMKNEMESNFMQNEVYLTQIATTTTLRNVNDFGMPRQVAHTKCLNVRSV